MGGNPGYGGGIASGGNLNIRNTTISGNSGNAAIFLSPGPGDILISRSRIVHNGPSATGPNGGGITSFSDGSIRIEDTTISNNSGVIGGYRDLGGPGTFELVRSRISGNTGPHGRRDVFAQNHHYQRSR